MKRNLLILGIVMLAYSAFTKLLGSSLEQQRVALTKEVEVMLRGLPRPNEGACLLIPEFLVLERCVALFNQASSSTEVFDVTKMNELALKVSECLRSYNLPCVISRAHRLMQSVHFYSTYFGSRDAAPFFGAFNKFVDQRVNIVSADIALFLAAGDGNVVLLHEALSAGANINYINNRGCSVLGKAIQERKLSTVKALLEAGVVIDVPAAYAAEMACYHVPEFAAFWPKEMARRIASKRPATRVCLCLVC